MASDGERIGGGESELMRWLFPSEPREFPGRRGLKIALRAVHVLSAGLLVGSYAFEAVDAQTTWLLATACTGLLILLVDLHETAVFLLQVRGLVVLLKLTALALLPLCVGVEAWLLGGVVVLSVLSSHAPSKVRYWVVICRGRFAPGRSRG